MAETDPHPIFRHPYKGANCEIGGEHARKNLMSVTEEFKREAVRLVRESAHRVAQVARGPGDSGQRVVSLDRPAPADRGPRHHTGRPAREAEELACVKRELARVTQERNFLRRAAAFFAKESR